MSRPNDEDDYWLMFVSLLLDCLDGRVRFPTRLLVKTVMSYAA